MVIGTAHFESKAHAISYFAKQGYDVKGVNHKLETKSIHIGPPAHIDDEVSRWVDGDGRWRILIGENDPDSEVKAHEDLIQQVKISLTYHRTKAATARSQRASAHAVQSAKVFYYDGMVDFHEGMVINLEYQLAKVERLWTIICETNLLNSIISEE